MTLTLVTGRAHVGKSGLVFGHAARAAAEGRPAVVLLPTFADVVRAREEMATRAPVGVEIVAIDRWIEDAWALHGDGRHLVDEISRRYFIRSCCAEEYAALGGSAHTPGFARVMARVAEQVASDLGECPGGSVDAAIFRIVDRYRRSLESAGLVEPAEAVGLLGEAGFGRGASIAAHRFTNIASYQEEALVLCAKCNEVVVGVLWEQGFPATECNDALVARLTALADDVIHIASSSPVSELGELERDLFRPASPHVSRGEVVLGEATGMEAEAALVASQAAQALADGFQPDRVAVCFRDLASRAPLLSAALEAEGVPFEIDLATKWALTPLGRSLSALIRLAVGEGGRTDALQFAAGVHSGLELAEAEKLDRGWRRKRLDTSRALLRTLAAAGDVPRRAVDLALECAEGDAGRWQALSAHLLAAGLTQAQRRPNVDLRLDAGANQVVSDAAHAALAADSGLTAGDLLAAVAAARVSTGGGERPGAVLITEAPRLRSRRFDVLIIGGLSAAEFAADAREPLHEELIARLCSGGRESERASERLLFYSLATRPRHRLVLTRPATTADGAEIRASVFWDEVIDLYRTAEQACRAESGGLEPTLHARLADLPTVAPAFSARRRRARARAAGGELASPLVQRGLLAEGASLAPDDGEYRVTEIEKYHACPYSWYFDVHLRTGELDEGFGARERGTFAHRLNQQFYQEWWDVGASRVTPEALPEALAVLERVALRQAGATVTRGLAEETMARGAVEWVRRSLEQDAELFCGFDPIEFEWQFGREHAREFVFANTRLRGSVDRIDRGEAGLIVLDYKSSTADGWENWEAKGLLQTVIYGVAASRQMDLPLKAAFYRAFSSGKVRGWNSGAVPEPALGSAKDQADEEHFGELAEWAEAAVSEAVAGIEAGDIGPRPRTKTACAHCGARSFCSECVG